jgi:hypothetical protein
MIADCPGIMIKNCQQSSVGHYNDCRNIVQQLFSLHNAGVNN